MRNAKNESNERLFTRSALLSKNQVQSFFSRMAASRLKEQGVVGLSTEKEEDKQCLQEYLEREDLINTVNEVKQRRTSYLFWQVWPVWALS